MIDVMFVDLLMKTNLKGLINNNDEIVRHCHEIKQNYPIKVSWHCDTYSSLKTYNIIDDEIFKPLIDVCYNKVVEFAHEYGISCSGVSCTDAWFNIALPGDYQELHTHPQTHFSVVYYADVDDYSGKTNFTSPQELTNMFPLPESSINKLAGRFHFSHHPVNQDLIIFRANIPHMVETNKSNLKRVSISMNFIIKNT